MYYLGKVFKRIFDIFASLIAIILLLPIWIIIPIAIKCDSKGSVFFKQERRTKNGKIFKMLKFRSMVVNAEQSGAGLFNYKDDPRVTKVGRFMRNTSIDELPQLFNIFCGNMSVVGPRPCVKYELGDFDTLNTTYKKRFRMKAGLTGLAQVMGRNDISWDEKVKYDNLYIDNFRKHGVFTDIRVLWLSVIKVFKKEDIYEKKADDRLDDAEAAKRAEEEIIRIAHLSDEEYENYVATKNMKDADFTCEETHKDAEQDEDYCAEVLENDTECITDGNECVEDEQPSDCAEAEKIDQQVQENVSIQTEEDI